MQIFYYGSGIIIGKPQFIGSRLINLGVALHYNTASLLCYNSQTIDEDEL